MIYSKHQTDRRYLFQHTCRLKQIFLPAYLAIVIEMFENVQDYIRPSFPGLNSCLKTFFPGVFLFYFFGSALDRVLFAFCSFQGRMALLVTLFLVLVNIFNAITTNSPKADGLNALQVQYCVSISIK